MVGLVRLAKLTKLAILGHVTVDLDASVDLPLSGHSSTPMQPAKNFKFECRYVWDTESNHSSEYYQNS